MNEPDDTTKLHDMAIIIQRMRDIAYRVSCDGDTDRELRGRMHDIMDYAGMVWDGRASRHDRLSWEKPKLQERALEHLDKVSGSASDDVCFNCGAPRRSHHLQNCPGGKTCFERRVIHTGEPYYKLDVEELVGSDAARRFVWEPGDIHHLSDEEIVGNLTEPPTVSAPQLQHTCGPPGQPYYHDDPHCARCMADNAANLPPQLAPDGCDASARRSSEAVTSEAETMENAEVPVSQADALNRNVSFRANAYCKTCGLSMKLHPTTDGVGDCSAAFRAHLAARSQLFRHCS